MTTETRCQFCAGLQFPLVPGLKDFEIEHSDFSVLHTHTQDEILQSAENGCPSCALVLQASSLLRAASSRPDLQILLYRYYPIEIHAISRPSEYDVVEIYPVSDHEEKSKPHLPSFAKSVPARSDSSNSLRFLEYCYNSCVKEHDECRQQSTWFPKRVVDISGSTYRLIETNRDGTHMGGYAALSYCWGIHGKYVTKSDTIAELRAGIPRDHIPTVFENAASIVRRLNIRYLWIDTICIIQDDEQDWEEEAASMAEIFQNALITIAASSSTDPEDSVFSDRDPLFREMHVGALPSNESPSTEFRARRKIALGMHYKSHQWLGIDPLDSRAWALQERELPARFVSFTRGEIQWRCKRQSSCECQETSFPSNHILRDYSKEPSNSEKARSFIDWHHIVEEYSSRSLTFIKDRLPALSGLATSFGNMTQSAYIAGLWKDHIIEDLSWQRASKTPLQALKQYLSPSFSWASIPGPSNYQLTRTSYSGIRKNVSEMVGACTVGDNSYGSVRSGLVTIRGPMIMAQLRSFTHTNAQSYELQVGNSLFSPNTFKRATCEFSVDALLVNIDETEEGEATADQPTLQRAWGNSTSESVDGSVELLGLYNISHDQYFYENFLILGRSSSQPDAYERIEMGTGKLYTQKGDDPYTTETAGSFKWLTLIPEAECSDVVETRIEVIKVV